MAQAVAVVTTDLLSVNDSGLQGYGIKTSSKKCTYCIIGTESKENGQAKPRSRILLTNFVMEI